MKLDCPHCGDAERRGEEDGGRKGEIMQTTCPACGQTLRYDAASGGSTMACLRCEADVVAPPVGIAACPRCGNVVPYDANSMIMILTCPGCGADVVRPRETDLVMPPPRKTSLDVRVDKHVVVTPSPPKDLNVMPRSHRSVASVVKDRLLLILTAVGFLGLILYSNWDAGESRTSRSRPQALPQEERYEWYSGGTLHHATMREWSQATYHNRLATCADFVVGTLERQGTTVTSIEAIKPLAADLERGISNTNTDGVADNCTVPDVAALILAMTLLSQ